MSLEKQSLARQIVIWTAGLVALGTLVAVLLLGRHIHQQAMAETEKSLTVQVDLLAKTFEFTQDLLKERAASELDAFYKTLPAPHIGNTKREVNGQELPDLMFGNISAIGNTALLEAYRQNKQGNEAAFLVMREGKIYRATTLLKTKEGIYRHGEEVTDAYARTLLEGKRYAGTLMRNGRMYALAAFPVKDAEGKVIGGVTMRMDAEANIQLLKDKMRPTVIGKTGYVYVVSEAVGDSKTAKFVLHPTLENKPISEIGNPRAIEVLNTLVGQKNGVIHYDWADESGHEHPKVVVFKQIPELHWIVASGSWVEEFTEPFDQLRYAIVVVMLSAGLAIIGILAWVLKKRLAPLQNVRDSLTEVGQGNLRIEASPVRDSSNEIDLLTGDLGGMLGSIKKLVHAVIQSSGHVKGEATAVATAADRMKASAEHLSLNASAMAASTEQMTVSISEVASGAADAAALAGKTAETVAAGKAVTQEAIDAMHAVSGSVRGTLSAVENLVRDSQEISQVLNVIRAIADQTNLLALNAAIEAARAGEVGRGFAVVADEVRKLAEQSSHSAEDIGVILRRIADGIAQAKQQVETAVSDTERGGEAATHAEAALEQIEDMARTIADAMHRIADSTREQRSVSESLAQQVEAQALAAEPSEQVATSVANNAQTLTHSASNLENQVGHFKV